MLRGSAEYPGVCECVRLGERRDGGGRGAEEPGEMSGLFISQLSLEECMRYMRDNPLSVATFLLISLSGTYFLPLSLSVSLYLSVSLFPLSFYILPTQSLSHSFIFCISSSLTFFIIFSLSPLLYLSLSLSCFLTTC